MLLGTKCGRVMAKAVEERDEISLLVEELV